MCILLVIAHIRAILSVIKSKHWYKLISYNDDIVHKPPTTRVDSTSIGVKKKIIFPIKFSECELIFQSINNNITQIPCSPVQTPFAVGDHVPNAREPMGHQREQEHQQGEDHAAVLRIPVDFLQ